MSSATIAFFGATGGCGLACLQLCLDAGYNCVALCRTPSKLSHLISPNLTIIEGDIKDLSSVTKTLTSPRLADIVIFSVGAMPVFKPNPLRPTLTDPSICQDGMASVLQCANQVYGEVDGAKTGPLIVAVSTTGISDQGRDIPLAVIPLYHWMLPVPHHDKKAMENALKGSGRKFVIVRPSLLTNGEALGVQRIREGIEGEKFAIGYTISRKDVGNWIFERCIKGQELDGKAVGITYLYIGVLPLHRRGLDS